jgi:hypothetical protein
LAAFSIASNASAVELEVTRKGEGALEGLNIEIINVDTKPIKITKITVNDRPDCGLRTYAQTGRFGMPLAGKERDPVADQFQESNLKVGDGVLYVGACRIIRATVETDLGSQTYTFRGSRSFD